MVNEAIFIGVNTELTLVSQNTAYTQLNKSVSFNKKIKNILKQAYHLIFLDTIICTVYIRRSIAQKVGSNLNVLLTVLFIETKLKSDIKGLI